MLKITQIASSGFSGPSAGDGEATLPDAYELVDTFSVDVKFEGEYEDLTDPLNPTYTYADATNVTSTFNWSQYNLTMTKLNAYTVRITGPANNVFTDQYYKFVLPDLSQVVLPADTTEPFLSLIKYHKPANNSVTVSYPLSVTIPVSYGSGSTTTESTTLSHTFWWSVNVAKANIARLKTQGLR